MVPIAYGLPDGELFDAADRGEVRIGGCIIWPDNPDYECRGTEVHYWQRADDGGLVAIVR